MMIVNRDFYKLALNLDHYMSLSPTPYTDPAFPSVPSARLGDIVLHFTHYRSSEEGIAAWNQRKQRIDYDNLYVIFHDMDLAEEEIKELKNVRCKKIVVMTSKDYGYDHCLYIPAFEGQEHVGNLLGKTLSGKWLFEKYFDFVGWVNSDDPVAQHFYIN